MTSALLFTCSFVFLLVRFFGWRSELFGAWGFGSFRYTAVVLIFTIATYYEYYLRNCWNNDLLCKTLPILLYANNQKPRTP
jgi:hypothetical protein